MSSFTGARSHASTVRASHSSRIAAGNASRLAAAGLAIFLTIGFAGTAHAEQPADVAAEVVGASAGVAGAAAGAGVPGGGQTGSGGGGSSDGGSPDGGSSAGAVVGGAASGSGHDVVVICHNGNQLEIDDDGLNGHEEHDGDPLDDGLSGDLADGSADECVKDHPIKVDDDVNEVIEDDRSDSGDGDDKSDDSAGKGGKGAANADDNGKDGATKVGNGQGKKDKKAKKSKKSKDRTDKAKGGNGKAKGGNGKAKGKVNGPGPDAGDVTDTDTDDTDDTDTGTDTGDTDTGTDTDAGVSGPGTTPTMPPKSGTATPEVLGEEAGRPKPVAPAKTGPADVKTDSKNRAPVVIGPQHRADRPKNEVLPAVAASRRGTARPGAAVLPQTGLGDDLGMLTGIGGAMVLLGGMTLTAGRRRTSSQI